MTVTNLECTTLNSLRLIRRGKVRDIYEVNKSALLLVATDRISAFDFLLNNTVEDKGNILTMLTNYWLFKVLPASFPNLKHHVIAMGPPENSIACMEEKARLANRSMVVKKYQMFPFECIVRGYITGSAWIEYQEKGTVHGMPQPAGLKHGQQFPGGPIYTPAIKAPYGERDENIHPDRAREMVGERYANRMESLSLELYKVAHKWALHRGIIIADTKFEFGHDEVTDDIIVADEILTPDCSRFWSVEDYSVGQAQKSFDKQFLCDWLTVNDLKAKTGVKVPDNVIAQTRANYREIFLRLTGQDLDQALASGQN
ncbi:unnamed protein product [Penicillium pancosmium]